MSDGLTATIILAMTASTVLFTSCKGDSKEKYAAALAGTAASLQIISMARSQSPSNKKKPLEPCCEVCDECSFPCGDRCVPIGAMCAAPKGCACYPGGATARDIPPGRASSCMQTPGSEPHIIMPIPMMD